MKKNYFATFVSEKHYEQTLLPYSQTGKLFKLR